MNVLQVAPTLSAGGAETLVAELALALARRGHRVGVALLAGARGARGMELVDKLMRAGVEVSGETLHSMRRPDGARSLAKMIRTFRPDVMHSHLYSADLVLAAVNALTTRQPLIRTIHNTSIQGARSRAGTWLLDRLYATTVACGERVADSYAEYFRGTHKSALVTVRNGIAHADSHLDHADTASQRRRLRASIGIPDDAFVYVHVGAFRGRTLETSQKAHDVLLKAFARLCASASTSRAHLLLIGDGELHEAARQLAKTLCIDDRVTFAGVLDNVPHYLAASDAFVFPSRYEGLPVALIEACMMRLPVVASALPEIAEVCGANGYVTATVDDTHGFASAMLHCLLDPTLALERAVRTAAQVAREFSIDTCAAHYEMHYERLNSPRASRITPVTGPRTPPVAQASFLPLSSAPATDSNRSHQETQ